MESICGVGIDPGSVNLGVGGALFKELFDVEGDDGSVKTVPRISLLSMERWDLESGITYKPSPCKTKIIKTVLFPPSIKSKKITDWVEPLAQSIAESDWMFQPYHPREGVKEEKLPFLIVENQFDHIKSDWKKSDMLQVSHMSRLAVLAIDSRKRQLAREGGEQVLERRACYGGMSKYGQRCDGSRVRLDRKDKGVDDLKELLMDQNDPEAELWLQWIYE